MATADVQFKSMNKNDYLEKTGNGSNVTVTFQQAADRAGIQSGDSLAVAFGKLAKFCADMQDYVFSAPIANLTSTDATRPLAASMGKQINDDLSDKINSISSTLSKSFLVIQFETSENEIDANSAENLIINNIEKQGYTPLLAIPSYSSVSNVLAQGATLSGNKVYVAIKNITSVKQTCKYYAHVLYIKNKIIES